MRWLWELLVVIVAGVVTFLAALVGLLGLLGLWLFGLVMVLFLAISAFAAVMFLATGVRHDLVIAVGYLGWACVPAVTIFVISYYASKIGDTKRRLARQIVSADEVARIADVRLARDETFVRTEG